MYWWSTSLMKEKMKNIRVFINGIFRWIQMESLLLPQRIAVLILPGNILPSARSIVKWYMKKEREKCLLQEFWRNERLNLKNREAFWIQEHEMYIPILNEPPFRTIEPLSSARILCLASFLSWRLTIPLLNAWLLTIEYR